MLDVQIWDEFVVSVYVIFSCDIGFCYNLEMTWWINIRVWYEDVITVDEIYGKYQEQYFNIYNKSNHKNVIRI